MEALVCPFCHKIMSDVYLVDTYANDFMYNAETKEYEPYALCPDQGTHHIECPECHEHIHTNGERVEELTNEMLMEQNN